MPGAPEKTRGCGFFRNPLLQFGYRFAAKKSYLLLTALFLEDFELSPEKSTGGRITVSPKDKLK